MYYRLIITQFVLIIAIMNKSFIPLVVIVVLFLPNISFTHAATACRSGYTYHIIEDTASCVLTSSIPKPAPVPTTTLKASPSGFKVGKDQGKIYLTLAVQNYPISSWGSTRVIFQGQDSVCVNHGNHPISRTATYTEEVIIKVVPPESDGLQNLSAQAFATDDCATEISAPSLTQVRVPKPCLNCKNEEDKAGVTATTVVSPTKTVNETQARQERKQKVDALLKMYSDKKDLSEIVFPIKLLISLDIIQV